MTMARSEMINTAPMRNGALLLLLGLGLAAAGGFVMRSLYPHRETFTIDLPSATAKRPKIGQGVLRVRELRVASPFIGRPFVCRTGKMRFEEDYCNRFAGRPSELLTDELIEWLSHSGLFASVVDAASSAEHRYMLEGNVTSLYGDYTDKTTSTAVIAARFVFLEHRGTGTHIVFEKPYEASASLTQRGPAALAEAWGRAYRQILTGLGADLAGIKGTVARRTP